MTRNGKLFWAKTAVILGVVPVLLWAYEYGPDVGYSGVPKDNGGATCATSGCHVGTSNSGKGSVTVNFPNGATYTPGVAQQLSVTVADPATTQKAWGFQLTARQASSTSTQEGSFTSADANTQVLCSDSTLDPNRQKLLSFGVSQTCPTSQSLSFIEHSQTGYNSSFGKTGSYTFNFTWTPPATNVGNIALYVAGNAADGQLNDTGDHIYNTSFTVTPAAAPNSPVITSVLANTTGQPTIGPNMFVNIFGTNLAGATDQWTIVNGTLPTQIDGVSVTIGGKTAYMQYVSPTQVQVLTPPNLGTGQVAVQVTTSVAASNSATVTSQTYAPGFFLWANNQPVTTHADFSDAMKNGTYAGLTTVPAKPGEYIVLWGTGFGPTNPATPAGTVVPGGSTVYYTASVPTLTLNNQPMAYYATALTSGYAGLYQVVAQVPPSMPNGDWPLVATIGGVSTPSSVLLTVHN